MTAPRVGGIVLCGGRSSRMGRPKTWLPFGDEVLLQRVVRVVGEAAGPVVVVAAPGQAVPPLPAGVEIVRDDGEGCGPLAGLAAGLAALDGRAEAAYLSSCDTPFLTAAFVRRVVELLSSSPLPSVGEGPGVRAPRPRSTGQQALTPQPPLPPTGEGGPEPLAAAPEVGGFRHPLAAVYRLAVRPAVAGLLAAGQFRLTALLDVVPTRLIWPHELAGVDSSFASLRNVNTPADYAAALRDLGGPSAEPGELVRR